MNPTGSDPEVYLDVFGMGFLVSPTGQFSPITIWLPSIIVDDNKQFPLEEVRSRAIATQRPLTNSDLRLHTLFYSETPHPQNREECDL